MGVVMDLHRLSPPLSRSFSSRHDQREGYNIQADVYDKGLQKQITAWGHWRNKAAHGDWDEYDSADVSDMINGVRRFVSFHLS